MYRPHRYRVGTREIKLLSLGPIIASRLKQISISLLVFKRTSLLTGWNSEYKNVDLHFAQDNYLFTYQAPTMQASLVDRLHRWPKVGLVKMFRLQTYRRDLSCQAGVLQQLLDKHLICFLVVFKSPNLLTGIIHVNYDLY